MTAEVEEKLREWAEKYNDPAYFEEDPISFPREFLRRGAGLRDIETAAVFAAHFAWGRRSMIVRDCERLFDEMEWKPYGYIEAQDYRSDDSSIHRTVKWSEVASICRNLHSWYSAHDSLESLSPSEFRTLIYDGKPDPKAPNKKINMLRRWMVRRDGKVDLGLWKGSDPAELIIPLDVHVYDVSRELGLTERKSKDIATALEITEHFRTIFPGDPAKGDFALFGYGLTQGR